MIPSIQLRLSFPVIVVICIVGCGAVYLHNVSDESHRKTIEFGSALVGGATAIYALLLNVQARRSSAAMRFLERWNSPIMFESRTVIGQIVRGEFQLENKDNRQANLRVLSFFEEVAIAIHTKEADEEIMKDLFFTLQGEVYRNMESWIKEQRRVKNQPTAYCQYEKLHQRWAKG